MSLDLYRQEATEALAALAPVRDPEPGAFDGFLRGTGLAAMRGFARAGRAVDIIGAVGPILQDKLLGTGTEAQDRYFREHDEVFGSAVDHWTPRPGEVGIAAEIAGGLISTLPLVIASPSLAVAVTQLGTAEDLMRKGVSAEQAQKVGAAQAVGLGLGIWVPILGQNLWQRVLLGGAGFNVAQGVAMRGAGQVLLEGTAAAEEFKAFDGTQLTLDVLLGVAFGTLAHVNPAYRQQGAEFWERIRKWGETLEPSQVQALATLRQAQHLNVDSVPGKLTTPSDVEAHVNRVRTAIDQLEKGQPVSVDDMPAPKVEPDAARYREATAQAKALEEVAEVVRADEGIEPVPVDRRIRDEQGQLIRVFHGTGEAFEQFDMAMAKITKGWGKEKGIWFTDNPDQAAAFARMVTEGRNFEGANIRPAYLEMEKPLVVDVEAEWKTRSAGDFFSDKIAEARRAGNDGVIFKNNTQDIGGAGTHYVVFRPEQVRSIFETAEAPAATRGAAEPPPPRGSRGGEAAGAEAPDMLTAEARTFAESNPDLKLRVGTDADGAPVTRSVKEFVADAEAQTAKIRDDARLLSVAAQCLLGVG